MRPARVFLTTTCFFLLAAWLLAVQGGLSLGLMVAQEGGAIERRIILRQIQHLGVFAIGWGVGVTGWLITGHQATTCFFECVPRAWRFWRKDVFTSPLPVFKYLLGGVLLVGFAVVLARKLWGLWVGAFDVGLMAGGFVGVLHSLSSVQKVGNLIDFLEANQRYVNEDEVALFTEYDKP